MTIVPKRRGRPEGWRKPDSRQRRDYRFAPNTLTKIDQGRELLDGRGNATKDETAFVEQAIAHYVEHLTGKPASISQAQMDDQANEIMHLRAQVKALEQNEQALQRQLDTACNAAVAGNRQIGGLQKQVDDQARQIRDLETSNAAKSQEIAQLKHQRDFDAAQLGELEARAGKNESQKIPPLPSHLVALHELAQTHHVPPDKLREAIGAGRLPIVEGLWNNRGLTVKQALDREGRARFYELFLGKAPTTRWPRYAVVVRHGPGPCLTLPEGTPDDSTECPNHCIYNEHSPIARVRRVVDDAMMLPGATRVWITKNGYTEESWSRDEQRGWMKD